MIIGTRFVQASRVLRSGPAIAFSNKRGVAHRFCQRTGLIERGGERDKAETRDAAITRLQPHPPLIAAGSRTEPPVSVPARRKLRRSATAAAEPPLEPPGTRDKSHGLRVGFHARILRGRAHRKFVHVRLAERNAHRPLSVCETRSRHSSRDNCAGFRRAGARLPGDADNVLDRDRDAAERKIDVGRFGFLPAASKSNER